MLEELHGNAPTVAAAAAIAGEPSQPVLVLMTVFGVVLTSVRVSAGSFNTPGRSNGASPRAGPEPLTRTDCVPEVPAPPTTKPAMIIFPPVPTWARQDMLVSLPRSVVVLGGASGVDRTTPEGSEVPAVVVAVTL